MPRRRLDKPYIDAILKQCYTCEQVAALFDVDRNTVYRWIRSGDLRCCRFSDRALIPPYEVEKIQKGNSNAAKRILKKETPYMRERRLTREKRAKADAQNWQIEATK